MTEGNTSPQLRFLAMQLGCPQRTLGAQFAGAGRAVRRMQFPLFVSTAGEGDAATMQSIARRTAIHVLVCYYICREQTSQHPMAKSHAQLQFVEMWHVVRYRRTVRWARVEGNCRGGFGSDAKKKGVQFRTVLASCARF